MPHKVTGKILEAETRWGVPDLIVEVWDKDRFGPDDRIGSSVTKADGSFALIYGEEDFREAILDRKPDLYLVVKRPDGSLLVSDEASVRSEAGRSESFLIQIPRETLGDLAPEGEAEPQDVDEADEVLSVEEEVFVREAISQERSARRRGALIAAGLLVVAVASLAWYFTRSSQSSVAQRIAEQWAPAVPLIETPDETGSGLIFDQEGHILTNYHVIDQGGPVTIQLANQRTANGRVIGVDPLTDLAVLQVDAPPSELVVAPRGDSDTVQVGDLSIAIGNPLGLKQTLTVGHVSAVNRSLETADPYGAVIDGVLQTDASINPGSSGGPLFNADGEVVGINTQIVSVSGGSVGLGFAVPINLVEQVAHELIAEGIVRRPWLGVAGFRAASQGLRVDFVAGRSATDQAGIEAGDTILSVGGQPVSSPAELNRVVHQHAVGETVSMTIQRDGEQRSLSAELQARPMPGQAVRIGHIQLPNDSQELNQEWVVVENQGYRTQNLRGYTLSNGQGDTYEFPDFRLAPLGRVRVYTGAGTQEDTALSWKASSFVWQRSDTAVLRDASGDEVDKLQY